MYLELIGASTVVLLCAVFINVAVCRRPRDPSKQDHRYRLPVKIKYDDAVLAAEWFRNPVILKALLRMFIDSCEVRGHKIEVKLATFPIHRTVKYEIRRRSAL